MTSYVCHVIIQTQGFRSATQFNGDDSEDVIDIYFVAPFTAADRARGFQFRPGYVSTMNPPLATNLINSVFISYEAATDNTLTTLAHEVLHQLTNKGHSDAPEPLHIVFPSGEGAATGDGSTPYWRRRIKRATADEARAIRPSASMTAVGNRLLRNP